MRGVTAAQQNVSYLDFFGDPISSVDEVIANEFDKPNWRVKK